MRTFGTIALGAALAAVASASDVESLTKDTFPSFVKDNDLVLAECQYLPQLGPTSIRDYLLTCLPSSFRSMFLLISQTF